MKIIAHRANSDHNYLENTKEAVWYCLKKDNIDGVEIDVRLTKDKKLVLNHNMTIDFVSDSFGLIKNKTLKELKKHTFGYNQKISTLEETLKPIESKKEILIEIKEESNHYHEIADKVYQTVQKYKKLNIILCSFNYSLINYLNHKKRNYKTALLIGMT